MITSLGLRAWFPLFLLCSVGAFAVLARMQFSGHVTFGFLLWNMVLAWVPCVISAALQRARNAWCIPLGILWLLFFPNAPYLLTDLVHLRPRDDAPMWFDVLTLGCCACAGMALGIHTLGQVHQLMEAAAGRIWAWLWVAGTCLLCGVGVYLGRFVRLNSWDAVLHPRHTGRLVVEAMQPGTLLFAVFFAAVLFFTYCAWRRGPVPVVANGAPAMPR